MLGEQRRDHELTGSPRGPDAPGEPCKRGQSQDIIPATRPTTHPARTRLTHLGAGRSRSPREARAARSPIHPRGALRRQRGQGWEGPSLGAPGGAQTDLHPPPRPAGPRCCCGAGPGREAPLRAGGAAPGPGQWPGSGSSCRCDLELHAVSRAQGMSAPHPHPASDSSPKPRHNCTEGGAIGSSQAPRGTCGSNRSLPVPLPEGHAGSSVGLHSPSRPSRGNSQGAPGGQERRPCPAGESSEQAARPGHRGPAWGTLTGRPGGPGGPSRPLGP